MAATLFVRIGGKVHGPFEAEQLKRLAAAGKISRDDHVSRDQLKWTPAGNVKGLFPPAELLVGDEPQAIPTIARPATPAPVPPVATPALPPQPQVVYVEAPAAAAPPQHITQQVVVNTGRSGNTCAILAALFAILALAFSWIPLLGLLTIPLAGLAILLAGVGLLLAIFRGGAGLITSLAGGGIALLAIVVALLSSTAAIGVGAQAVDESVKAFEEGRRQAAAELEAAAP